jgi:proteic killer suppression protein
MNYRIIYTPSYNKRAARFIRKHPDLIPQYEKTLKLLEIDPFHPSLRLHRLKGSLSDLHSVSINISYRITLELVIQGHEIIPVDVGSYDGVYA